MTKKSILLILLGILVGFTSQAFATDYYVAPSTGPTGWGNGSNGNSGLSKSSPFLTLRYSFGQMSGGDTLIIADGTYTGSDNMLDPYGSNGALPPEGSSGNYTIVRAENDFGVVIDGQGVRTPVYIRGNDTNGGSTGDSPSHDYIEIRGIVAQNSNASCMAMSYVNHVKFINCMAIDAANGNTSGIQMNRSSFCLIEGCVAFGNGRYEISLYLSNHGVIRNCVVRNDRGNGDPEGDPDGAGSTQPFGGFISYSSYDIEFQNCIDVNSDQTSYWLNVQQYQGSFGAPATTAADGNGPTYFRNCIALKNKYRFSSSDPNGAYDSKAHYVNSAAGGIISEGDVPFTATFGQTWFDHCTFIDVDTESGGAVSNAWVNGWSSDNLESEGTIWANFAHGGIFYDPTTLDNNDVYNNGGSFIVHNGNSITETNGKTYNPESSGLKYLTRIEDSSQLETNGIGATILYQYGTSGTVYGEAGYNTITTTNLWPWANEDTIKIKMQEYSYDSGNLTGNRGFASSTAKQLDGSTDVTLTSYIWEYLGNQMPSDIYSGSSSFIAPTTIYEVLTQPSN